MSLFRDLRKLRKVTISFVLFVLPSAWSNSAGTAQISMKFDILVFFENLRGIIQDLLQSD